VLATSDFHIFDHLKDALQGHSFTDEVLTQQAGKARTLKQKAVRGKYSASRTKVERSIDNGVFVEKAQLRKPCTRYIWKFH
jgi:hypothetical protein